MGTVLMVIGGLWAVLGLWNLYYVFSESLGIVGMEGVQAIALVVNGGELVVPGLILFGVGFLIERTESAGERPSTQALFSSSQGPWRKCPFCSELIAADAWGCRHCGKEVPEIEDASDLIWDPSSLCAECGEPFEASHVVRTVQGARYHESCAKRRFAPGYRP